ncbi:MAG: hypothetical protein ACKPHU_31155, partial [Planctomycetaceae bacterium]
MLLSVLGVFASCSLSQLSVGESFSRSEVSSVKSRSSAGFWWMASKIRSASAGSLTVPSASLAT